MKDGIHVRKQGTVKRRPTGWVAISPSTKAKDGKKGEPGKVIAAKLAFEHQAHQALDNWLKENRK